MEMEGRKNARLVVVLVTLLTLSEMSMGVPAKITLFQGKKKGELFTKQCNAGMQLKKPVIFSCACITGVWGFYTEYCSKPVAIAGGDGFCFKMTNNSISQLIPIGNPNYPFEPTLSILTPDFTQLLAWLRSDNATSLNPTSAFITVSDTPWTLTSDKGDSLCLKPTRRTTTNLTEGNKRIFCLFNTVDQKRNKWKKIVKVNKGCVSNTTLRADSCADIKSPNDFADCKFEQYEDFAKTKRINIVDNLQVDQNRETASDFRQPETQADMIYDEINIEQIMVEAPQSIWIPIKPKHYSTTSTTTTPTPLDNDNEVDQIYFPIRGGSKQTKSVTTKTAPTPNIKVYIDLESSSSTPNNKIYIDLETSTPTPTPKPKDDDNDHDEAVWIPVKPNRYSSSAMSHVTTTPKPDEDDKAVWIPVKSKRYSTTESTSTTTKPTLFSSSSEEWIPIKVITSSTTTEAPSTTPVPEPTTTEEPMHTCDDDQALSRDTVKKFWLLPENYQCSRSLNEVIFADQLRRFTVKQFDHIFDSRLKSLRQMEQLLNLTKEIMLRTCSSIYVPPAFFTISFDAFLTFVKEDFFYGVEPAEPDVFPRVVAALGACLDRAGPHIFEHQDLDCGIKKISGYQILPGKRIPLQIPDSQSYKNYEILIEIAWKMFLNSHSYCFQDFKFSNDHHHFALLILQLFTKSIWEKWIEPPSSLELYTFILPNFNFLQEYMSNIDYCVSATGSVSSCPVWLTRTGTTPHKDKSDSSRNKRSIWIEDVNSPTKNKNNKSTTTRDTLGGEGYCLQRLDDQILKLNMPNCPFQIDAN